MLGFEDVDRFTVDLIALRPGRADELYNRFRRDRRVRLELGLPQSRGCHCVDR